MFLPRFEARESKRVGLKIFTGLDRRDKISNSALSEMTNMSPDAIPSLTPREPRQLIAPVSGAKNICSPKYVGGKLSSFTGVRGNTFVYNGTAVSGTLSAGEKSIADFNGKICIFPDKVYYDYIGAGGSLTPMEKSVSASSVKFYSSYSETTGAYTAYISASGAGFDSKFKVGDSVVISGCSKAENNTKIMASRESDAAENDIVSVIVQKASPSRLDLLLFSKGGRKLVFTNTTEAGTITVKTYIPDMDHICVHNNRLWGTAVSGECVYASKLGDCTSFNSYQGLSDDSWYGTVGTDGEFVGICSYRTAVVAFKRNCIHHIYGDSPINFSMPKQTMGGCIDGRSIREIGGILYYLGYDGFMAYNGGEPYNISAQLKHRYTACAAGADAQNYYAAATRSDNAVDVLVYNPDLDIWVREDDTKFVDFCTYNGDVYGITETEMWRMKGGTDKTQWCVVSKRFTYDEIAHKGVYWIFVRMNMKDDSTVRVCISRDGRDFEECGVIKGGKKFSVHRIPVRFGKCDSFRIMLEGEGDVVIHDIEISSFIGGMNI